MSELEKDPSLYNDEIFRAVRPVLWDTVVPSYFSDGPNPRLDNYQTIKMLRTVLMCLKDLHERTEELEQKIAAVEEDVDILRVNGGK